MAPRLEKKVCTGDKIWIRATVVRINPDDTVQIDGPYETAIMRPDYIVDVPGLEEVASVMYSNRFDLPKALERTLRGPGLSREQRYLMGELLVAMSFSDD